MVFQTLLFYKYLFIPDAAVLATEHLAYCRAIGLTGRIIIGDEGINGTVSGTMEQCNAYMEYLNTCTLFKEMEFKIDIVDTPSFNRMHVRYRKEIVSFGNEKINPHTKTGIYLQPAEFLKMKDAEDVIILDARNTVEHQLGRFKNAYTLDINNFRDFPAKLEELKQFKNKKIVAYCTGGIRCEKATAFLLENGFKNVYQLHGGIIRYGKETGGVDFDGKCYVFDKRLSIEINTINPKIISICKNCGKEEVRMVNCANPLCNEHFVQCSNCGNLLQGACSEACKQNAIKREYDGTGYYAKA